MYYLNQTLYHKKTLRVVALHPHSMDGALNWEVNSEQGLTRFIDEFGDVFLDDLNEYTHFEDFFGRPASFTKEKSTNPYVETTLKKYLVFGKEREEKSKIALEEWFNDIIQKLNKNNFVRNPFADGSRCVAIEKHFIETVGAEPLYKILSGSRYTQCREYKFTLNNKLYLIRNDDIIQISI